jgi:preprotein translocase subunit SecG
VDYILGFLNLVIVILTLFLIILILIQRGKGGGLAGAFGGMGGSSAFGARTGDVFTKVTVGVAIAWILLSMLMVILTNRAPRSDFGDSSIAASKELGTSRGASKSKLKGASDAASTPTLPPSARKELPDDLKALTELPGALDGPPIPSKKD